MRDKSETTPQFGPARKTEGLTIDSLFDPHSELFLNDTTYIDANALVESYSRLQLLYGFSRALCGETELVKMPEAALEALVRLVNLERCFVATLDEAGKLEAIATYNIDLPAEYERWPVSRSIVKRVVHHCLPVLCADTTEDDRYAARHSINLNRIRTVMSAPLGTKGNCIGLIYADSRSTADSFSHADLLFLVALSQYLYLGIRHTREQSKSAAPTVSARDAVASAVEIEEEPGRAFEIIGHAPQMRAAFERLRRAAEKEMPIFLIGETGTGKELFARAAHRLNARRARHPFYAINIAALPETLVESELFGHEKGAFSNATAAKPGKFELAEGGTLFLDEVAEISPAVQAKLLRVLETGEFERIGGTKPLRADIRLVCATNKDLDEAVKKGHFRPDLYYRIKGVTVNLPPLREHIEDLPALVAHILAKLNSEKKITAAAMQQLAKYDWPGNVRQLIRALEEVDAICETEAVDVAALPDYLHEAPAKVAVAAASDESRFLPLNEFVARLECEYIQRALALTNGNNDRAIEMLGISRAKFFDRKKAFGL